MKSRILAFLCLLFLLPLTAAAQTDGVTFNYTGVVKVRGQAFDGTGLFKLAIVSKTGDVSLWSNDSTSASGAEPDSAISASVVDGVFSINVGDPEEGMDPIHPVIFNNAPNTIRLRIWFSDGKKGFQRLHPDRRLNNIHLLALESGTTPSTIYVDGTDGYDLNDGLSPERAKRTIQAAVDVVPDRLNADLTIKIAPGTYREQVEIFGISTKPDTALILLGDETWMPSDVDKPEVRITGAADDSAPPTSLTGAGVRIRNSNTVEVEGVLFDYHYSGFTPQDSTFQVSRCLSENCYYGMNITNGRGNIADCLLTNNQNDSNPLSGTGVRLDNSSVTFRDSTASDNPGYGSLALNRSKLHVYGVSSFNNNGLAGLRFHNFCAGEFRGGSSVDVKNNGDYGLKVAGWSNFHGFPNGAFSGNTPGDVFKVDANVDN